MRFRSNFIEGEPNSDWFFKWLDETDPQKCTPTLRALAADRRRIVSGILQNDEGCWIWQKCLNKDGYGAIRIRGETKTVHRLSYELFVGEIPVGCDIDHLCWIRSCCNPGHLRPLDAIENRRRQRPTHQQPRPPSIVCGRGHELRGNNLYVHSSGRRGCRACNLLAQRRYKARLAATAGVSV